MKRFFLLLQMLCSVVAALNAQNTISMERTLNWAAKPSEYLLSSGTVQEYWTFSDCNFSDEAPTLPLLAERFALPGRARLNAVVTAVEYEPVAFKNSPDLSQIGENLRIETQLTRARGDYFAWVRVLPFRRNGASYERVKSISLRVEATPEAAPQSTQRGGPFTYESVLNTGDIFKFGVQQSGIYKLDYTFLKNELGISNLDNIDPRSIRIFGNGGRMLPERNGDARPDDLLENAIRVVGEEDGKFNTGDFILFYAVGPKPWTYKASSTDPELSIRGHYYDPNAWYFVKVGSGVGLRIFEQSSLPPGTTAATTEEFDDVQRIEDEKVNLLDFNPSSQGAGKRFFGDYFFQTRERDYSFEFPNLVTGANARVRAEFAGRCEVNTNVRLIQGNTTITRSISGVDVSNNEAFFALNGVITGNLQPASDKFSVKIAYPPVGAQSEGWLDYIEINARRRLTMTGNAMEFRDVKSLNNASTLFRLSGASSSLIVWDITVPQNPQRQQFTLNGSVAEFGLNTSGTLRNFIAFTENANFPKPEAKAGKIANQNLHALDNLDMAIVYHPDVAAQASQLAEHRRNFSGLNVALVDINQLYNEFSSGAKDPVAIRDMARMLYERNPARFRFLLLFGDASFDPRNNTNSPDNLDLVPTYETSESFSPIFSYPSDDFMGLLDVEDGILTGALDISVGRIPVHNPGDAQAVVDKILDYDKNPQGLGDWRLRNIYIADDEDGNAHINQADKLAQAAGATEEWFNLEKIYFDAYQQVATSGGQRYPDAKAAINANVFRGGLVLQYIGHGGPRGWAQERVTDQNDIAGWENPQRYPLIITATCSFGGYDDYSTLTGGEQALLKPNSGAVGLFTTVRAVYIDGNNKLTDAVQRQIFLSNNGQYAPIGDILTLAKNNLTSGAENARRFTLLGDPAMYLGLPEYRVATSKINGKSVVAGQPDTLKALMPVELEGIVTDTNGVMLTNFNGTVDVSIYDKEQVLQTLGQDAGSQVRTFRVQRNILYKGSATVSNGTFKVNFVIPKDINYTYGFGKISYYAENGTPLDAAGADENIIIGGNANLIKDEAPPIVRVYLNTDAFVSGGITNDDPKILIACEDDYGMNVSGVSLGHDLTAVLDDNVLETLVLNDFYESELNNAKKGRALYPLNNLAPGRHTLRAKGWDIANNSGEGYTEFIVAENGQAALDHVLNYPNPFTTNTNFQFEHNLAGQLLDVQISIFTVSGRLVKTILHNTTADGFRVNDISWDGKDEFGDQLARGVYLYHVKVRGTDVSGNAITAESDYEKLVILR